MCLGIGPHDRMDKRSRTNRADTAVDIELKTPAMYLEGPRDLRNPIMVSTSRFGSDDPTIRTLVELCSGIVNKVAR